MRWLNSRRTDNIVGIVEQDRVIASAAIRSAMAAHARARMLWRM